jgi:hypothetical protein
MAMLRGRFFPERLRGGELDALLAGDWLLHRRQPGRDRPGRVAAGKGISAVTSLLLKNRGW